MCFSIFLPLFLVSLHVPCSFLVGSKFNLDSFQGISIHSLHYVVYKLDTCVLPIMFTIECRVVLYI